MAQLSMPLSRLAIVLLFVGTSVGELFTLTASPEATDGRLCPEDITFTCRTENVTGLGTAIRWFFNDSSEILFDYVYVPGQTYPQRLLNGTFQVVVESAELYNSEVVNAVVHLTVSPRLLQDMGVMQLHCGRTLMFSRTFNISGIDDSDVPSVMLDSLTACYTNDELQQVDLQLTTQVYNTMFCAYKMSTMVVISTLADGVVVNSDTSQLCSGSSCSYSFRNVSSNATTMIQITLSNSLGLSANRTYNVPTPSFELVFAFNNQSCQLLVECRNIASPQALVADCQIFNTTSSLYEDLKHLSSNGSGRLYGVTDKTYYFEGRSGPAESMLKLRQSYRVTGTESCDRGESGGNEGQTGVIVGVVVALVVGAVILAIVAVVIGMVVYCRKKKKTVFLDAVHMSGKLETGHKPTHSTESDEEKEEDVPTIREDQRDDDDFHTPPSSLTQENAENCQTNRLY